MLPALPQASPAARNLRRKMGSWLPLHRCHANGVMVPVLPPGGPRRQQTGQACPSLEAIFTPSARTPCREGEGCVLLPKVSIVPAQLPAQGLHTALDQSCRGGRGPAEMNGDVV